ncbi:type II toxin-antitoxin system HicB family antitoxin [Pseudomonas protegens]|uniref:type II toxin-antitoxin system HicB family antitoxin n=1 Tax=Pseudomonas protegens TaxID=380021 RepID=UPI0021562ABA|nr:type II toxin-antitoxin system HicB family antitoxin [Pseudomonas protegens]
MFDYPVTIHEDENPGVAVTCDDLPEFNSAGDDVADALRESVDGIETALSIYVDQRRVIPKASDPKPGQHVVRLPAVTVAKIVLWNEMMARDMRKADLCRLLGLAQTQGDRLVDFLHTSKMEAIEKALNALGRRLVVTTESFARYEVIYTQDGARKSFFLMYNDGLNPWTALLSGLKLSAPKDLESPSAEQICRAHGISDAFGIAT